MKYNKMQLIVRQSLQILMVLILIIPDSSFAIELEPIFAPINPEFIDYINEIEETKDVSEFNLKTNSLNQVYPGGIVPEPFVINKSSMLSFSDAYNRTYPYKFDLREFGKVTTIKDQGQNGSCWTFAAYSSLESYLLPDEYWDFSEKNMRNNHGFDWGPEDGGNRSMSTAYLARWDGPVLEAADPYSEFDYYSPKGLPIQKHLTNVLYIPDRKNSMDNELIKNALMEYGAVQTSIYSNKNYFNRLTASHYYNGLSGTDHAVSIIGWDDNYSRYNFLDTPLGDGAFLVKNSWGPNWGQEGYFFVSYHDIHIGKYNAVYIAEEIGIYDNVYQYDQLGMTGSVGYNTGIGWFANIFDAGPSDQYLNAVGFFVTEDNIEYEVYVCSDYFGSLNNRVKVADGNIKYAGYHTINFPSIEIKNGSKFAVIVKVTGSNNNFQIPLEYPISRYTSKASAHDGQSFFGPDGYYWTDANQYHKNTNVTLKAFTSNIKDESSNPTIEYDQWEETLSTGDVNYSWTIEFSMPLDEYSVNKDTVYIKDENGSRFEFISPEVYNGSLVRLKNTGFFDKNNHYYIMIEDSLKSVDGNKLDKGIKIEFIIE